MNLLLFFAPLLLHAAELTEPRQIFTVTKIAGSEWLIAGGHLEKDPNNGKVSDSAEILKVSKAGRAEILPNKLKMLHARWGHRATRLSTGDIFICGGSEDTECETLWLRMRRFSATGKLAHARSAAAQALLPDGKVLITGGYNKGDPSLGKVLSSAEIFDPFKKKISPAPAMTTARAGHTLLLYGSQIFVIGGLTEASATVETYDFKKKTFSKSKMVLPYGLKDFQMHQTGKDLYLIGGTKHDGNSTDKVLKLDLVKQTVREMPGKLSEPREDLSLCVRPHFQALVFSGERKTKGSQGAHSEKAEIIRFKPFSIKPSRLAVDRDDAQTISLGDGSCLVLGGTNKTQEVELSILRLTP